ncbi:MAG: NAD(P)H-binding protein [Halioglobus sp.]
MAGEGISVVMIGATGAVGTQAAHYLMESPSVSKLALLGRNPLESAHGEKVVQHTIDIFDSASYENLLSNFDAAICTLGVGEPSSVSKEDFVKIDKLAVLDFARACRHSGVRHFQLLSSIAVSPSSKSFFLRTKGELEGELRVLEFDRLSLFHPSMIITPGNRYGLAQAISLKVWPALHPLFVGKAKKLRGITSGELGRAMACNSLTAGSGEEVIEWDGFKRLLG